MYNKKLFRKMTVIAVSIILILYTDLPEVFAAPGNENCGKVLYPEADWNFKREITIENRGDKASDAVIELKITNQQFNYAKANAGGADIRFSTTSGKLTGNGLSYWIEKWNDNGMSSIWIKVPVLKGHATNKIYMYYGNSTARPFSNGNATFIFFDDFEEGDYTQKWNNVSIREVVEQGGMLKLKESDGQDGIITTDFNITGQLIVRTLYQRGGADQHWTRAGIGGWNNWLCFGDHTDVAATGTNYVMLFDSASITSLTTAPLAKATNKVITDKWRSAVYWYDGKNLKGMQDDAVVELPAGNASSKLALRTLDNDSWDNFAFITVSAFLKLQPVVALGQQKSNK